MVWTPHQKITLMGEGVMTQKPLFCRGYYEIGTCELEKHQIVQKRKKSFDYLDFWPQGILKARGDLNCPPPKAGRVNMLYISLYLGNFVAAYTWALGWK